MNKEIEFWVKVFKENRHKIKVLEKAIKKKLNNINYVKEKSSIETIQNEKNGKIACVAIHEPKLKKELKKIGINTVYSS